MRITKRKTPQLLFIFIFVILSVFGFIAVRAAIISNREAEREAATILEQQIAYARVNFAFRNVGVMEINIEEEGIFRPLCEVMLRKNDLGIFGDLYILLLMYEINTGNTLAYETVIEYFSQEFEPDGSLRLYNNGNHPEIYAYVEWMWEGNRWRNEFVNFVDRIIGVLAAYYRYNRDNGASRLRISDLTPQMFRELARVPHVIMDPESCISELNLTNLQE